MTNIRPAVFILDVDGVMTTGQFFYSEAGKVMKVFGADDNDGLNLLKKIIEIRFISADKRGFKISQKRIVDDMGFELDLVKSIGRVEWIKKLYPLSSVIYMGDGMFDHYVMKKVGYSIATNNADQNAKDHASYITKRNGGERAVAEACLHILDQFYESYKPNL